MTQVREKTGDRAHGADGDTNRSAQSQPAARRSPSSTLTADGLLDYARLSPRALETPPARLFEPKRPAPPELRDDGSSDNKAAEQTPPGEQGHDEAHKGVLRRPFVIVAAALLALTAVASGYIYWDYASHFESTDDAFIQSRQFGVAPKVAGYITAVPVTDNQHVAAGDVVARIDDRDYRIALEQAQAQVAAAKANLQNIDAQISVQQAQITASQAQVEQAQAALTFAEQQAARYADLAQRAAGTVQMAEQTASTLRQDQAAVRNSQAALTVAQRQIDSLKAQRNSAEASLAQAYAQRDQAELNLSYTTVTAAQAGRVVNLTAAVGQYAQAGTNLTMFVPDDIWVVANYKETQLAHMRPGQTVTMRIDAYSNRTVRGHVDSVQSGSGAAFSLLPPENATGNFIKVVQRVPVKIVMENPPADVALGPGMSVVPTTRIDPRLSLYERMTGHK
jgi:membrane fusion protein (multidrug efflux system)